MPKKFTVYYDEYLVFETDDKLKVKSFFEGVIADGESLGRYVVDAYPYPEDSGNDEDDIRWNFRATYWGKECACI